MKWIILENSNIEKYISFVDSINHSGIWHYPEWLEFQLSSGRAIDGFIFCVLDNDEEIIFAGIYLIQKSALGIKFGYIPGGPLYKYFLNDTYVFFLKNIAEISKNKNIVYTQLDSITKFNNVYNNTILSMKDHITNQKLPIPAYTNKIDISMSFEQILEQMRPKGRYNIKLAEKKGVMIVERDISDVDIFYNMLLETTKRDNFRPNPKEYYISMLKCIQNSKLLYAIHENDIICGGIFTFTKNQGLYYYGASSNIKRNLMAPYLLQCEAINRAKELNCKYYDFMGLADPNNANDQLLTVTDFKLKFGGETIRFQSPYHIIHQKAKYFLYQILRKIRSVLAK